MQSRRELSDHMDNPAVSDALILTIRAWIDHAFDSSRLGESQFGAEIAKDNEKRRQLLKGLLPLVAGATIELLP